MASKIFNLGGPSSGEDDDINVVQYENSPISSMDLKVLACLQNNSVLKPQDIAKKTKLSLRSVRYCLKKLIDRKQIIRVPDLEDLRSYYYKAARGIN